MEITARLTRDAQVKTLPDQRQVVGFTVALNKKFKSKNGDVKENTQYVDCSYWLGQRVAQYLTKGTLVGLYGDMGVNCYVSSDGQPRANLTFHVNDLKIHGGGKRENQPTTKANTAQGKEAADDLPF